MIIIALGSNLSGVWGTPAQTIERALQVLNRWPTLVLKAATPIVTAPFGNVNQPNFINTIAVIETALSPFALLRHLQMIEHQAGRRRGRKWGPRTLDLDIVDYHGRVFKQLGLVQKNLVLPHPGIAQRLFVLQPIAEIASRWKHPLTHKSALVMIQKLYRLKRP